VLAGEGGQLDAEAIGKIREPLVIGLGQLHHEVVGNQRPTLRHNGRAVVHLTLHRAGYLHRLQLGLERPSEGTLDHPLEPVLEALQYSHRGTSSPCSLSLLTYRWYRRHGAA